MVERWLISDTHFCHNRILEFEKSHRPFYRIEDHDEALIENWNSVVKPEDKVYHLGDFVFGKKNVARIASRLNGHKRLILGNHDQYGIELYIPFFEKIYSSFALSIGNDRKAVLTHIPVHTEQLAKRFAYNIHGHYHHNFVKNVNYEDADPRYINVSCEQINLTPINWDELMKRMR